MADDHALHVAYSTGELFQYTYDAVGSTLEYSRTLAGLTTDTAYTYNAAYQLITAQESGGPLWSYTYDGKGQLVEASPDTGLAGARRYGYSTVGYLAQVELHDGAAFQLQAEMAYNGLGDRLSLTAYVGGSSLTTEYALDLLSRSRPLAAAAAGQTTFYLYGLGAIAEQSADFRYYLKDADRTARQLVDPAGELTLARSFTPWGEPLEQVGGDELAFGYFGGLLDAATGLLYLGSGQYYDPDTGRFLAPGTRDFDPFQPGGLNPYLPWSGNPLGALLGPLGLLLLFPRRKSLSGRDRLLLILLLGLAIAGAAAACEPDEAARIEPQPAGALPPTLPPEPTSTSVSPDQASTTLPDSTQSPPPPADLPLPSPSDCDSPFVDPVAIVHRSGDYGLQFYDMLNSEPGWWNREGSESVTLHTYVAIVINLELNGLHSDPDARDALTEAFARKYWDGCNAYGPDGCQIRDGKPDNAAANYLGSRDVVRNRVIAVRNGGSPHLLVRQEIYNYAQAQTLADEVLRPTGAWRSGGSADRPWEWANVVEGNPSWFKRWIAAGPLGADPREIYYVNRPRSDFYVVTSAQMKTWCINRSGVQVSCVDLTGDDPAPEFVEEFLGG